MLKDIHLIIAIITGLTVLYADEQAAVWVLGKRKLFHPETMKFLNRAVTLGLTLLLITGGLLYAKSAPAYLSLPVFDVKMVAVFALIINTYAIHRLSQVAITRSFGSLSPRERLPLYVSGAVSFLGWAIAFICGLLIS